MNGGFNGWDMVAYKSVAGKRGKLRRLCCRLHASAVDARGLYPGVGLPSASLRKQGARSVQTTMDVSYWASVFCFRQKGAFGAVKGHVFIHNQNTICSQYQL